MDALVVRHHAGEFEEAVGQAGHGVVGKSLVGTVYDVIYDANDD